MAAALLRSDGDKLIVVHAQGAQHVLGQHQTNHVMVKRGLPTAKEWAVVIGDHNEWGHNMEYEPENSRSEREPKEGFMSELSKGCSPQI